MDETLASPLANARESELLAAMRVALREDLLASPAANWPDVCGDLRLLRFLRGYSGNASAAATAFRDFLAVRAKYRIDELHHERWHAVPCDERANFPHEAHVMRTMPGHSVPAQGLQSVD